MTPETLIAEEEQRREDLARRYGEIPEDKLNRITHAARVCIAIELDDQLRKNNMESPGEVSARIVEVTGLTRAEVIRAISNSGDSTRNNETYIERANFSGGYGLSVTEAGRSLVEREVQLVVDGSST